MRVTPLMGGRESQAAISILGLGQVAAAAAGLCADLSSFLSFDPLPPAARPHLPAFVSPSPVSINPRRRRGGDRDGFVAWGSELLCQDVLVGAA